MRTLKRWAIIGARGQDSLEYHLQDTLRHMGYDVEIFDMTLFGIRGASINYWLRRVSDKYDRSYGKKLAQRINQFKPDAVLATYRHVHPVVIDYIRDNNPDVVTMHLNPDALVNLEQQQVLASAYDFWFTKDPYMQKFMRDMAGLNAYYLPEAFNPRFHKTNNQDRIQLEHKIDTDILVFGNMYAYRTRIIEQIEKMKLKVKLYGIEGPFFPHRLRGIFANEFLGGSSKSEKVIGSRIVLNAFHYSEIEGVNCKYFEINGIGGFQLCDYKDVLKEYSAIGPELYSFKSMTEAKELIRYYLAHPEERYAIADKQRDHFLSHHTYEHRIRTILATINSSVPVNSFDIKG